MTTTLFERDDRFTAARVRELHRIVDNQRLASGETRPGTDPRSSVARHRWVVGPAAIAALFGTAHKV